MKKIHTNKNKKRLTLFSKIIIVIVAAAVVAGGVLGTVLLINSNSASSAVASGTSSEEPIASSEEVKEPATVHLLGVGDNLIHSSIYNQAATRAGGKGYDFDYVYEDVADIIKAADIASVNQEGPIDTTKKASNYPLFNTPSENGDKLVDLGFDVVNMANNHCLDMGSGGLVRTIAYWRDKGVVSTGLFLNEEETYEIPTIEKEGIVFSFLGYTEMTNGLVLSSDSDAVIAKLDDALMKRQVEAAKEISDVVVVNIHWGNEYWFEPSAVQKDYAQKLVSWGADIILGHHPHVLQPIEYIERDDGSKAVVAYSLGNFVSGMHEASTVPSGIIDIAVTKDFSTNEITITDVSFTPLVTHYNRNPSTGGATNIKIMKWADYTQELASEHGCRYYDRAWSYNYAKSVFEKYIDDEFIK